MLPLLSCDRSDDLAGIGETRFVGTMAELQRIERDLTLDSAGRTTARRNTLQERDLTPEQLEAAARALADDPTRAQVLWAQIDSLSRVAPDTAPVPPIAPAESVPPAP